jgi:hypothetical protein
MNLNLGKTEEKHIDGKNKLFSEKFIDVHDAGNFAQKMREKYYQEYKGK